MKKSKLGANVLVSNILKATGAALASKGVASYVTAHVPTGYPPLDTLMGGGIPVGRLTEISGDEGSGKSTLAFSILAQVQKMGGIAILIETECALERVQLTRVGVDPDNLIIKNPETMEAALDDIKNFLVALADNGNKTPAVIVWDSLAASDSEKEINSDFVGKNSQVGLMPRLLSAAMRRIIPKMMKASTALVVVNQVREKIGVMWGDNRTTPGGRAVRFYSTFQLQTNRKSTIKMGDKPVGIMMGVYAKKSKLTPPFWRVDIPVMFDTGIDAESGLLAERIGSGEIRKRGKAYFIGKSKTPLTRSEVLTKLRESATLLDTPEEAGLD